MKVVEALLILVFVLAQIMDFYTTWLGLKVGMVESNPWLRIVTSHGTWALVLVKSLGTAICVALIAVIYGSTNGRWRLIWNCAFIGLNLYQFYVVFQNTLIILELMGK